VVKPEYFVGENAVIICGALFDYMDNYGEHPRPSVLADKIKKDCKKWADEEVEASTLNLLKTIYKTKIQNIQYITDRVREFSEEAEWRELMIEGPDLIDQGSFEKLFDKAAQAREKGYAESVYEVTGQLMDRMKRLVAVAKGGTIPVGIKHFDKKVKVYPPAFGMIIGESSSGKTWFGLHIAKAALFRGKNVAFFSGEMTADEIATRFDAALLGINTSHFMVPQVHQKIIEGLHERYEKLKGEFSVRPFQAQAYSVNMLELDIRRLLADPKKAPHVIVVDYMELMTFADSDKRKLQGWEELKMISNALKGIANKYKVVLWALATVSGEEDDGLLTRKNKAGAKATIYAPDYMIVLNRNKRDKELGRLRLYLDKGRHMKDQLIVGVRPDFDRSLFCTKSLGSIYRSQLKSKDST